MVTQADLDYKARFTCPARMADPKATHVEGADYWQRRGPDIECSYCRSMHPEDWFGWCRRCAEPDSRVRIDTSDKAGKWYIVRDGITHPGMGSTRFYHFHLPKEGSTELERLEWNRWIGTAVEVSVSRAPARR